MVMAMGRDLTVRAGDVAHSGSPAAIINAQRDRIEDLERILGLKVEVHSSLRLAPDERKIFGVLLARQIMTKEALFIVLYGARPDCDQPTDIKIVDVQVCKLRAALKRHCIKHGLPVVEISTQWGTGYFMTQQNKARARALLAGDSQ
jgi:DNA-binding response OmpR family regulator